MKNLKYLIIVLGILFISSCEKELIESSENQNSTTSKAGKGESLIKNGRLYFSSKEEFQDLYKNFADASEEKLYEYFQPLYEKGFYSLRPIVSEKNEEFLYRNYLKKIEEKGSSPIGSPSGEKNEALDYLDYTEEIVGDDTFAAFLDFNSEIQIVDEIYKYTDVGLFIVKEDKYQDLQKYLEAKNIPQDLTYKTDERAKEAIHKEFPINGITQPVEKGLSYFRIQPILPDSGYGGGTYNPTPGSVTATDPSYNNFVKNLSYCTPSSGLFGNLFGDNNVCKDKYERRRRVKTKAFNYNYLLVYHLGVKCVHQYRGWTGFWRIEAIDEIRLVVEAGQFQYDLDKLLGNTAINNQTKERIYFMNNQKILYLQNSTTLPSWNWGTPAITYANMNALPMIFKDDLSFEFFSTGWDWLDNQIQNGIDSNLKASKLNDYFYNNLYSTVTSQLQGALGSSTTTPANRTFVAKFPENGKLIFQKSFLDKGFGIGVRKKTFDWGAEFSFNVSETGGSAWRFSPVQGNILTRPENFRVKIIGAARRGNGWHGSKFNVGID